MTKEDRQAATAVALIATTALLVWAFTSGAFDRRPGINGGWIYEYQALIGAGAALFGALYAGWWLRRQIKADDVRAERAARDDYHAVRDEVIEELRLINVYWRAVTFWLEHVLKTKMGVLPNQWLPVPERLDELQRFAEELRIRDRLRLRRVIDAMGHVVREHKAPGAEGASAIRQLEYKLTLLELTLSQLCDVCRRVDPVLANVFVGRKKRLTRPDTMAEMAWKAQDMIERDYPIPESAD